MAFNDLSLSFLTFPQVWTPGAIAVRFLVLPSNGDPLQPLIGTGPPFAGTAYAFAPYFIPGLEAFPDLSVPPTPLAFAAAPAFNAALATSLFQNFKTKYGVVANPPLTSANVQIKKALPQSYLIATGLRQGQGDQFSNDKDFGCALNAKDPGTTAPKPSKQLSWGQLYSFALRQPRLAMGLGLLFEASIPITPAHVAEGGWLFVDFAVGANPYAAELAVNPDLIRVFAARIPPLGTAQRTLFAPVLFPVGPQPTDIETVTAADLEAQRYDRGFGLIVHCNQPDSIDAAVGDPNASKPASDAGIQLGWDDEQVTLWHNRQLQNVQARAGVGAPIPLPLGVSGYRVDARESGSAAWHSLHAATAKLALALPPDTRPLFEPPIEPAPARALGADLEAWLPRYFAQWRGGSLAVADSLPQTLIDGKERRNSAIVTPAPPAVTLRYGKIYDFRIRFADLTQGGPLPGEPSDATDSGTATCHFKRFIAPKSLRTRVTSASGTITRIDLWRPILSYPEFAFAGVAVPVDFAARAAKAKKALSVFGAADPDVQFVKVTVEARAPAHDTGDPATLDGPFRMIYDLLVPLPPSSGDAFADPPPPADALTLEFSYVDVAHISQLEPPALSGTQTQTIPVPRARDLRIRLKPVARHAKPDAYFGNGAQDGGIESHFDTRSDAGGVENVLFDPSVQPVDLARALIFQPGDNIPQRLANELQLQVDGLTLSGPAGERWVFGASRALRHTLSGDHSALTFAALTELLDHWIVALRFTLNRDWTWDGLAAESFTVIGDSTQPNGIVELRRTVSAAAIAGSVNREVTRVMYFDAVDPRAVAGKFPIAPSLTWTIKPQFEPGLTTTDSAALAISLHLPKADRPSQVPLIASAGIALTPYEAGADYAATNPRRRSLWIEFTEPIRDPDDVYFARVLGYGPDPLLAPYTFVPLPDEPALPIDPEPVRVIAPGQSADTSGLGAMQAMTKSTDSDRHYLLPLPPGIGPDARELFGFWTYEIRVGHSGDDLEHWSTAQARYGRPLRVTGVQHPAPSLTCYPYRDRSGVSVRVPFASPVFGDRRLISGGDFSPRSEIWVLLYAQALQADGASCRNILLLEAAALYQEQFTPGYASGDPIGVAAFPEAGAASIAAALAALLLPADAPLSVLAVELLPGAGPRNQDPTIHCTLSGRRILRTSPLTAVNSVC